MRRGTWWQALGLLAVLAYVVWVVAPGGSTEADTSLPPGPVAVADLPVEAWDTLALVDDGGPFPYDRDGAVFMNREGLLPAEPRGYWNEFTVPTPGESDRGARRLVVGDRDEVYYTDDHYASFHRVERGDP